MGDNVQRRLSAIVAADVVGYSRLVGLDEVGTIAALRAHRTELIEPKVAAHGGRVVKTMGDGLLLEFPSIVNATRCAVELQQGMAARNQGSDPARRIVFRIGVNLGDIVIDGDDILGDGVNIAARLQEVAAPGGIAISNRAHEDVQDRIAARFEDGGEQRLKNIARPVRIWRWPAGGAADPPARDTAPNARPAREGRTPAVTVEAFRPAGDLALAEDLADELRSELVAALSRRSGLTVATGGEAGRGGGYLLSGRCHVVGARCRLNLAMVLAGTGESVWTERIDGEVSDLFGFIDAAVSNISGALRVHFNAHAGAAFVSEPDAGLSVQELLSKAAYLFYRETPENAARSRAAMEVAARLAPENPMVIAMQAWSLGQLVPFMIERARDVDLARAMALADRAVHLGPRVDFAFHCRAWLRLWLMRDPAGCFADAGRSIEINPSYHKALQDLALGRLFGGDPRAGVEGLDAVIRQVPAEPQNPFLRSVKALGHLLLGEAGEALQLSWDACERQSFVPFHALVHAAAAAGDDARTGSAAFRTMVERHRLTAADARELPFARPDDAALVEDRLRRAGLAG